MAEITKRPTAYALRLGQYSGMSPRQPQVFQSISLIDLDGCILTSDPGEIEGHESYRLQLWPAEEAEAALIKYWDGYDIMRPDG